MVLDPAAPDLGDKALANFIPYRGVDFGDQASIDFAGEIHIVSIMERLCLNTMLAASNFMPT